ncbi:MAG: primosomal protein N' [Herpetosiphonaceae bacterium]|nr:primosomal protein N' [Herpetosiphonaceae bacterium]
MTADLLADVAVHTKRGSPYSLLTYQVPPSLRPILDLGMLVWVPLRKEQVQGIILRLYEDTATLEDPARFTMRPINDLSDPEIHIPPHNLALARWLSDYYHAPLWDAFALLLPPGAGRVALQHWFATEQGYALELGSIAPVERGVLYYLRHHGPTPETTLPEVLNGSPSELRRATTALATRGFIARQVVLSASKARPRYEHTARLQLPPDHDWEAFTKRARGRAAALRELMDRAARLPPEHEPDEPVVATGIPLQLLRDLAKEQLIVLGQRPLMRNPLDGGLIERDTPPELTALQAQALAPVIETLDRDTHAVFLLHGVTGSGKTELYLRALARALRQGKQAVVLVPEIALTAQLVRRFAARFGATVTVLHSELSLGERYDTWRRLQRGEAQIVVGSRSAIFAPVPKLGLIILDEEHDPSYKHEDGVRYHARDVALQLGQQTGSPVLLGSATPAVESFHAAQHGYYQLLNLPERVTLRPDGRRSQVVALPPVTLVDMRVELHNGNYSIFSRALQAALHQTLDRQQQALLFLNRRGLASFVLCRDCGYVVKCAHCSSPLVVHATADYKGSLPAGTLLRCHTCGYRELPPLQCPQCWSHRIRHFGAGTQRVVEETQALLPSARIIRWDRDTTTRKGAHDQLLRMVQQHEADIIVGTQMIAKGLDLPLVTLVGVVSADTGLHMPDFRAGERAFQLLAQVAGRAGRRDLGGRVIVQSYTPEHYALQAAATHDYHTFFREEIAFRAAVNYPPYAQLARLTYSSTSQRSAEGAAMNLAIEAERVIAERRLPASIIGPAPAFTEKLRDRYRWHLLICAPDVHPIIDGLGPLPGWTVDVDPYSLL